MTKFWLLFILGIFLQYSYAQVQFTSNPFDIGIVTENGADFVDIPIKNTGNKKIFIFRTDVDKRFLITYSSKTILPDSTVFLRVIFSPDKKGNIREILPIHFSHLEEPMSLYITGYTEEIPKSTAISCPSFSEQNINTSLEHDFTVKVIDRLTGKPLEDSQVKFIRNGVVSQEISTNKNGEHNQKLMLGYYYFVANHEGYYPNELAGYINRKNNSILIPLQPMEKDEEIIITIDNPNLPTPEIIIETDTILEEATEIDPYPDFSLRDYRPNNIVFLIDVSSSMNFGGKMDLLKASMIELTQILRPVDKITLVAYASSANVILETTFADNKDTIIDIIQSLKPKGMTAGGKGMNLSYSKACNALIPDGNNQIIMATDGVFNIGEENVNKLARKFNKKGVTVSVVGIKNRDIHKEIMENLAKDGGGNYVNIETYDQAKSSLIKEIKSQSKVMP